MATLEKFKHYHILTTPLSFGAIANYCTVSKSLPFDTPFSIFKSHTKTYATDFRRLVYMGERMTSNSELIKGRA